MYIIGKSDMRYDHAAAVIPYLGRNNKSSKLNKRNISSRNKSNRKNKRNIMSRMNRIDIKMNKLCQKTNKN